MSVCAAHCMHSKNYDSLFHFALEFHFISYKIFLSLNLSCCWFFCWNIVIVVIVVIVLIMQVCDVDFKG